MKTIMICLLVLSGIFTGCQKDDVPDRSDNNNTISPAQPIVTTGWETFFVSLPLDSVLLKANVGFINGDYAFYSFTWSKLNGPGTISFSDASNPSITARGLQEGVYAFEAKAVGTNGYVSRDTQIVVVGRLSTQPKDFDLGTYALSVEWGGFFAKTGNIYSLAGSAGVNRHTYFELQVKSKQTNNQWETASSSTGYTGMSRYVYHVYSSGEIVVYDLTNEAKANDSWWLRVLYN